jgi:hypothetical protein
MLVLVERIWERIFVNWIMDNTLFLELLDEFLVRERESLIFAVRYPYKIILNKYPYPY